MHNRRLILLYIVQHKYNFIVHVVFISFPSNIEIVIPLGTFFTNPDAQRNRDFCCTSGGVKEIQQNYDFIVH